ncbi:MAG: baseplate J/gp47 family protein [Desulfobulbaceae bacterium]|jgi:phage-related baseplate assembly protein|nr:baseplate J/gp47 family protein [Desulfobulbaceae bacterium]
MNRQFLPDISFCETDTARVEAAIITGYEAASGHELYPGDPVRLFLEGVAAIIAQQNVAIDFTGKQNLLHYANGDYLDHLGAYLHTDRLPPSAARAMMRFTLSAIRSEPVVIPPGIRVRAGGQYVFATEADLVIEAGQATGDTTAVCQSLGAEANGLLPGQIKNLMDPIPFVFKAENITTSNGGQNTEDDERLRQRIALASEAYGSAGSLAAWRYHALSAHQGVMDVAVWQPQPGSVHIAPLMRDGQLPDAATIAVLHAHLNRNEVRPFTDDIQVTPPQAVTAAIRLRYAILVSHAARSATIAATVAARVEEYVLWQKAVLGRDIVPSKLIELIQGIEGIQRVVVEAPAFQALEAWQSARLSLDQIIYEGLSNE